MTLIPLTLGVALCVEVQEHDPPSFHISTANGITRLWSDYLGKYKTGMR